MRGINRKTAAIICAAVVGLAAIAVGLGKIGGPGAFVAVQSNPDHGFPHLNVHKQKDAVLVPRAQWTPIITKAATCVNWLLYHHNDAPDGKGTWNIFRISANASQADKPLNISQGTGSDVFDISPSRSPDGQWIAFASNRNGKVDHSEIYITSVDGKITQRVTYTETAYNVNPMWSPDGSHILFESDKDGSWGLYIFDIRTGKEPTPVAAFPADTLNGYWSPDSSKILFESNRNGRMQIFEADINTPPDASPKSINDGQQDGNDDAPAYSPDGKRISFVWSRPNEKSIIYVMNLDSSGLQRISDPNGSASNQVWSPDNKMLAYQSDLGGKLNIYIYDFASQKTRQLTNNNANNYAPTWMCDSPTVAFTSDVIDNNSNIFTASVLPIDAGPVDLNTAAKRLTFTSAENQYPLNWPFKENASHRGMPVATH